MVLSYTSNLNLRKPAQNDVDYGVNLNSNSDDLDGLHSISGMVVSVSDAATPDLDVDVAAGRFRDTFGNEVVFAGAANQTLTASATNYLYIDESGSLTINTTGFPSPILTPHIPLASVVTNTTQVVSITDVRTAFVSLGAAPIDVLNIQRPGVNLTGSGFQTVASFTVPANTLGTGNCINVRALMEHTTGTDGFSARITYGSTDIADSGFGDSLTGAEACLFADGATGSQRAFIRPIGVEPFTVWGTASEDSTTSLTLTVSIDLSTDSDVFVCRRFEALLIRAP